VKIEQDTVLTGPDAIDPDGPDPNDPRERRRIDFRILFFSLMAVGIGNNMLFALLPPIAREVGIPDAITGWIFSFSAVLWVICSSFWGQASDRMGRRPVIVLGLAAYAVSMAGFTLFAALGLGGWLSWPFVFVGLILARAIFGAVGSAASPAATAYVADRTERHERTEELAALGSSFAIGSAVGPAGASLLSAKLGLLAPLVVVVCLAAGGAFAVHRFLKEETRVVDGTKPKRPPFFENLKFGLDPRLSPYLVYGIGLSTVTGTVFQILSFYMMDALKVGTKQGAEVVGIALAVHAMALVMTQLGIIPRLRFGPRALMSFGALIVGVGLTIQILYPTLGGIVFAQFVQGIGFGLARSGFSSGASLSVQPEEQGAAAGLVVAVNGAGFIISPLLGGMVYARFGHTTPYWLMIGLLAIMAVYAFNSRRLRRSAGAVPPSEGPDAGH
jgi:MFS family permease